MSLGKAKPKLTIKMGVGEPEAFGMPKHMLTEPDDDGGEYSADVSERVKDAALDVAEALGIDRGSVDAEDLARALQHFDHVCGEEESETDSGEDAEHEEKGY